jgi:hypothetical protein
VWAPRIARKVRGLSDGRRPLGSDAVVCPAVTSAIDGFVRRSAGCRRWCSTSAHHAPDQRLQNFGKGRATGGNLRVVLRGAVCSHDGFGSHPMSRTTCETGPMVLKPLPQSVGVARSCARALQNVESRLRLLRERNVAGSGRMRFGTGFAARCGRRRHRDGATLRRRSFPTASRARQRPWCAACRRCMRRTGRPGVSWRRLSLFATSG